MDLDRESLRPIRDAVLKNDFSTACRAWGHYWDSVGAARVLFLGDGDLLMSRADATQSLEPRRDEILASAEPILAHRINGWGDVTIQHGPVVNFDADYGKNGKYGFHYWGWSRKLIQSYLLSGDAKYLKCFGEVFNQWYEQRNSIHGEIEKLDVVYYELGLGLRCRPFIEFYALAKDIEPATHERILKTMLGSARWLYEEEKRQYRGGNWQIMGSFGLAWIGLLFQEFKEADSWVRMGTDRIARHTEADFFLDGCHSERVPSSYMLVAYRDPRNLASLLQPREEFTSMSKRIREPLKRTLSWYFATLAPDGIIPAINDGSRALFPAALKIDAKQLFDLMETTCDHSVSLPSSGFTVMRSDASRDARYMLINHGPSGGGHSHADSLSFELHAYGQACAIDSGIGYTYDDPLHRTWYVRSRAHNMLTIDGDDLNRKEAEGKDVAWTTLKFLDYFAATHNGYLSTKGVTHRRHFIFVKPEYWLIYDTVEAKPGPSEGLSASKPGPGSRSLIWNLHTPAPDHLLAIPASDWKESRSTGRASVRGIAGFEGKDYADIDWISFQRTIEAPGTATLGVLLFPFKTDRPHVSVRLVKQDQLAAHFAVEHPAGIDHIFLGDPTRIFTSSEFAFQGACAIVRRRRGEQTSYSVAKSLTLKVGEKSVHESVTPSDSEGNV